MPETPRQRRTSASILEGIRLALTDELQAIRETEDQLKYHQIRSTMLEQMLSNAEKNGEAE